MNEDKYTKLKVLNCPICGTQYMPSEERTIPTCSKPDCIREYKRRGLPLTIQPAQPAAIPRQPRKRTRVKSKKSESARPKL